MNCGTVILVGAGCGRRDLITLRGLRALQNCQAVVFDDLIDRAILDFAPKNAERIWMGKRSGLPSAAQEDICAALIRLAREGKNVVRLKGGDPFVFGRGGEELAALEKAGVPWEEIPGITSAIAIPAAAGIPVTCRRLSRSVHIVTAHTAGDGGLPEDFDRLAALEGTLVFLMGLKRLPEISKRLIAAGKNPETPAAVLSGGNARYPADIRGSLRRLPDLAREADVKSPAVIVVGPVAALSLKSEAKRPLAGLRVGLTGTPDMQDKLSVLLEAQGAQVFSLQEMEVIPRPFALEGLLENCPWIVFTSPRGVDRFFQAFRDEGRDVRSLAGCRFAVVGAATEETLWKHGIQADLRPETFTTAALGEALAQRVSKGTPVLLLRSAQSDNTLTARLEREGLSVQDIRIYDVRPGVNRRTGQTADAAEADYLVFSSAGGVRAFLKEFDRIPPRAVCAAIGEVTAAALTGHAAQILTASEASAVGVVQAILSHAAAFVQCAESDF